VAPYAVLFKPDQGLRILRNESGSGFSPKAAYIFRKQLEEADAIVINRIDELSAEQRSGLHDLVSARFPGTPILAMSARTFHHFKVLAYEMQQSGNALLDAMLSTISTGIGECHCAEFRLSGLGTFPVNGA